MTEASLAPKDGNETNPQVGFCDGTTLQLSAPSWVKWSILAPTDAETPGPRPGGQPRRLRPAGQGRRRGPGLRRRFEHRHLGEVAAPRARARRDEDHPVRRVSDDLRRERPRAAKLSLADTLGTDEVAQAIASAAGNAKLTPASPKWADVEAAGILQDLFVKIAQGGEVAALAADADQQIEDILNG